MKNLMKKSKKGFTLMEMLIVVAIIAILVVIAIPTFNNALNEAREQTDIANARAYYAECVADAMLNGGTITAGTAPTCQVTANEIVTEGTTLDNFKVIYKVKNAEGGAVGDTIATFPED